ncbi:hypothetical protein FHX09_001543 [Rhizobium sp. BK538]|nr:hypothetical protein [Rhizobium sp. BK060]MBB4167712.1 hypothetical protein [Rhizobium sp. BK538]TCM64412.1 hypothetical protein EV291_14617 [Rhizobium sp. BK068]
MILRHKLRDSFRSRPGSPGRERERQARGTDIILIMMAALFLMLCAYRILFG